MRFWTIVECTECFGSGLARSPDDTNCPACNGYGKVPQWEDGRGLLGAVLRCELAKAGAAFPTYEAARHAIEMQ